VKHTPEDGFSIPGSQPEKNLKSLLTNPQNRNLFITPQPPPASRFDFLTTEPTNVSGGYFNINGEE